jgi:hypothetical protein
LTNSVFKAFFGTLAPMRASAHLIQIFDSTVVRASVGGRRQRGSEARRSGIRAAASRLEFMQVRMRWRYHRFRSDRWLGRRLAALAARIAQRSHRQSGERCASGTDLYDTNDEEAYRGTGVGIYNRLRSSWERGPEDVIFAGVILRHRDYIDAKNLKRVIAVEASAVDVYCNNFKKCSDIVEVHDPSRGRDAAVPAPDEFMSHVKFLTDWATVPGQGPNVVFGPTYDVAETTLFAV